MCVFLCVYTQVFKCNNDKRRKLHELKGKDEVLKGADRRGELCKYGIYVRNSQKIKHKNLKKVKNMFE